MRICTLPGIGQLLFFEDPEGNLAGPCNTTKRRNSDSVVQPMRIPQSRG